MKDFAAKILDVLEGWMNMNAAEVRPVSAKPIRIRTELDEPCNQQNVWEGIAVGAYRG